MKATINYKGIDFDMEYTYEAGERGVWRDSNNEGYPDTSASVEIISIHRKDHDWTEILRNDFEEIELLIIAHEENHHQCKFYVNADLN
jgi:hypothetical protein